MEPTVWLIRAGERSRLAGLFARNNVVALGWTDVPGLGDLTSLPRPVIHETLRAAPHITAPDQDAAELLTFRDEVRTGDIVVTPDATSREILLGEVTGDYRYLDPSPAGDYRHVRTVVWYGRLGRDLLPAELGAETNWRRTIRRLDRQDQWRALAGRVRGGEGRPATTSPVSGRPASRGSRYGAAPPGRACPSCGLVKAVSQYTAGDERCVDCR